MTDTFHMKTTPEPLPFDSHNWPGIDDAMPYLCQCDTCKAVFLGVIPGKVCYACMQSPQHPFDPSQPPPIGTGGPDPAVLRGLAGVCDDLEKQISQGIASGGETMTVTQLAELIDRRYHLQHASRIMRLLADGRDILDTTPAA